MDEATKSGDYPNTTFCYTAISQSQLKSWFGQEAVKALMPSSPPRRRDVAIHAPARTPRTPALMPTRSASVNPIGLIGREEAVPLKLLHLGGQELEVLLMEASLHCLNLCRGNRPARSQRRL